MFGHRSFLLLDSGGAGDIMSLIKGGYEISSCEYSFQQGTDMLGKAVTRVLGGVIHVTLSQLPPQPIIDWAMRPRKFIDGMIVLVDAENVPLEKIFFEQAICSNMKLQYVQTGNQYMSTTLLINTSRLIVCGDITFENGWTDH